LLDDLLDVTKESFEITYAAHTASCTFLLDAEGFCRRIVMVPRAKRRDSARSASQCVGAQYVASLDSGAAGGLIEMPRVGASMLFARVDERGRVSLVRTGAVTSFEAMQKHDPFVDSASVETSAPVLAEAPRSHAPRSRPAPVRAEAASDAYLDPSDRTQRLPALRDGDAAMAAFDHDESEPELATSEYRSARELEEAPVRSTMPSPPSPSAQPTLRNPHRDSVVDEEEGEYAARPASSRGMLPRRSDPHQRAARAYVHGSHAHAYAPIAAPQASEPGPRQDPYAPPAASDVQIVTRRR